MTNEEVIRREVGMVVRFGGAVVAAWGAHKVDPLFSTDVQEIAQSAGDLDPDSANEEIEATSSDPAWRLAAFTAYTDATSCTPVPRLLAPADEA